MIQQVLEKQNLLITQRPLQSLDKREQTLRKLYQAIENNSESICMALAKDLKKSTFESYVSEIDFVLSEIRYALKKLRKWARPKRVGTPLPFFPAQSYVYPTPLGKVLIIAPWNYPFMLALSPLVGAIAAGNQAIVKPSELSVHTSAIIHKIITETFDQGLIAVCEGGVAETTELLEQRFDHIFYTGNGQVAKIILEKAARHLTPITLELGGKSPCLVFTRDRLDLAAKRVIWGKFFNCGQTCVAPDYILIPGGLKADFVASAERWIKRFYGNDPLQSDDYGKIINQRHYARLDSLINEGDVILGNQKDVERISPTLVNADFDSPIMRDEIFGPILPIIEVDSLEESIAYINGNEKPLAAYGFFDSQSDEKRFISEVACGGMTINDTIIHLSNKDLPFGGMGESGMGHYMGKYSFTTFSHEKAVMRRSFALENSLRYPPYQGKLNIIRNIMRWFG